MPKRIQQNIVLGEGERGRQRKAALMLWAKKMGLTWDRKGSISQLMQRLADNVIANPEEFGLKDIEDVP